MINIRIIQNDNDRLEILRPILLYLVEQKQCKINNNMFITESTLSCNVQNNVQKLFYFLQLDSVKNGFSHVCYNIKHDKK